MLRNLKQKAPDVTVGHLIEQQNIINRLKKLGCTIAYPRSVDKEAHVVSVVAFDDASEGYKYGQLGEIIGLLFVELKAN